MDEEKPVQKHKVDMDDYLNWLKKENRIKNEVASKLHEEWDNEDKNKSQSAKNSWRQMRRHFRCWRQIRRWIGKHDRAKTP